MKILLVSHSGTVGSTPGGLANLVKGLKDQHEFHCVSPKPHRGVGELMESIGATMHYEQDYAEVAQKNKIELIISNTIVQTSGYLAAKLLEIPHIWWIHEILSNDVDLLEKYNPSDYYYLLASHSDSIVAVSNAVRKDLEDHGCSNVKVVYNQIGVGSDKSQNGSIKNILNISNIARRKDVGTFIKAIGEVRKRNYDVYGYTSGYITNRNYYDELIALRRHIGLSDAQCKIGGYKRGVYPFDRKVDLLVHTAVCEPFGMGIIEAMAEGLPVISTRCGGPEEIIVNGETGYLCDVGDYETITDCIVFLIKNADIANKMGRAGYERVKSKFNWNAYISSWRDVINETVADYRSVRRQASKYIGTEYKEIPAIQ